MLFKNLQNMESYHDNLLCGYKASPGSYKLTGNLFQSPDTDIEVHIRNLYIPKNNLKGKKFIKFKVDQLIKRSFWLNISNLITRTLHAPLAELEVSSTRSTSVLVTDDSGVNVGEPSCNTNVSEFQQFKKNMYTLIMSNDNVLHIINYLFF